MVLIVRLAHFSVREYLESDGIYQSKAAAFGLKKHIAHKEIAQVHLVYLLEPQLSQQPFDGALLRQYPLALFAAISWHNHHQKIGDTASDLDALI